MDAAQAAMKLRLCVLGHTEVEGPPETAKLHAQPKLLLLLAYVALAPTRAFLSRDQLVGAFWPDQDEERARSSLRTALYSLRSILGANVLLTRGDDVGVDTALLTCDALDFSAALKSDALARALELYRGPLLEGVLPHTVELQHWLDEERERYRGGAADAAWKLAERYESSASDLTSAARWARRAAKLAGTDERRIRRVMQLLERAGDTAGAVGVYEEFVRFLERELAMDASRETVELARAMRARRAQ